MQPLTNIRIFTESDWDGYGGAESFENDDKPLLANLMFDRREAELVIDANQAEIIVDGQIVAQRQHKFKSAVEAGMTIAMELYAAYSYADEYVGSCYLHRMLEWKTNPYKEYEDDTELEKQRK